MGVSPRPSGYDLVISEAARTAFSTPDYQEYLLLINMREALLADPTESNPDVIGVPATAGFGEHVFVFSREQVWVVYRFLNPLVTEVMAILFRPPLPPQMPNP